ncbi:MAG TPA: outer membrane lipoprotein-sorting protein [Blastocatellia bacterium]|nr:outer membrane lipoprotein-sorting protein [Blastocatellia bacterium]
MKRLMTITLICFALAISSFAQSDQGKTTTAKPAAALPSVDQVLDKYVQAIGGKAAIEKVNTRVAKGTFDMPAMGLSGPIEMYAKAPNKAVLSVNLAGVGSYQRGHDGAIAWELNPALGMREMSGGEMAQEKRGAEFYRDIKLKQLYPKMEVKGIEKVGDRDAYVIEATPAEGGPEKMYFDTQTGLLVRADIDAITPQGTFPTKVLTEDYREVDGIKVPFTLRQSNSVSDFTIKFTEIKHNVPIDDAKFNKPSGQ